MKQCFIFISLLFLPLLVTAQIPDAQISNNVTKYFERNRLGPELVSTEVVNNYESGRTLKLKIIANRSRSGKDIGFAFAAAAAVANMAEVPFVLLMVEMDISFKDVETTMAIAPANCTIDAMILGNREYEVWWKDCLQFP